MPNGINFGGFDLVNPLNRIRAGVMSLALNVRAYWKKTVSLRNALSTPTGPLHADFAGSTIGTGANSSIPSWIPWTNPANITASGSSFATVTVTHGFSSEEPSQLLEVTNVFSGTPVPGNAIITGILFFVTGQATAGSGQVFGGVIKGGVPAGIGSSGQNINPFLGQYQFGGQNDLWGTTWTPSQINSEFGVYIQVHPPLSIGGCSAQFNNLFVYVYYNIPGSTTLSAPPQTICRLNDSTPQGPFGGFSIISSDSEGNLYTNSQQNASGLTGNPVSIVPFRPNSSVQPWAYVGDPSENVTIDTEFAINKDTTTFDCFGQVKVRSDGLIYKTGIKEPQTAPTVGVQTTTITEYLTLPATTPPWTNIGGQNPNYNYGGTDPQPPFATIISTPVPGATVTLTVTGTATVNGATHSPGDSGPSTSGYPGDFIVSPQIVVFAFTDGNGNIIAQSTSGGAPPVVGNVGAGATLTVPNGASQLQIGIDSQGGTFSANGGSFLVEAVISTSSLPLNTAISGIVTCNYWGDSPHSGSVGVYLWKNPNDPGGSSQYDREVGAGPTNGAGFGSVTNNSLIVDNPTTGSPTTTPEWTTLDSTGGVVGSIVLFGASIEPPNATSDGFADFNCCFTGSFFFPEAGQYAVTIENKDQINFGIGGGVTSSLGTQLGYLGQTETVVSGLPLLCVSAPSGGGGPVTTSFTITVPAPGIYPFEIDWDYWHNAGRTLNVQIAPTPGAGAALIPPLTSGVREDVSYACKYRNSQTGAQSNPSPTSTPQLTPVLANTVASPYSPDPQVDKVDYYRQDSALANYTYVGTGPNDNGQGGGLNTAIVDTLSDAAAATNQIMDLDDFEPVPSIDTPKSGMVTIISGVITWTSGDQFNTRWLAGTIIEIGSPTQIAYSLIARPTSPTTMIIPEVPDTIGNADGTGVPYNIAEPILANQPLQYMFGPTDNINFAFAVGDSLRPGTLYWSKGSNLDSWPDTNQQDVTDPSEPLVNGAMTGGLGVVFSIKRAWVIVPNFFNNAATVTGVEGSTWTLQATSIPRGLFIPLCLCVSGGGNIFFRVDDGIHVSPGGRGSKSITDESLYPLFSHEGSTPQSITRNRITFYPPDDTHPQNQKFQFVNGYLYYDYLGTDGNPHTLVFDEAAMGWVPDVYSIPATCHATNEGQSVQGVLVGCNDNTIREMVSTGGVETPSGIVVSPAIGGQAYMHMKEIQIEYSSNATSTMSFNAVDVDNDSYAPQSITLPSTSGTTMKLRVLCSANKWKLLTVQFNFSDPLFRLYIEGLAVSVKPWGSSNPYNQINPFADTGGFGGQG